MSAQARWPSGSAYVSAVQHPESAFADARLRGARVREGLLGLPASASGQNAIVFPVAVDGGEVAVRCFTTPALDGRERYEALGEYLESHPCDVMARARWLEHGISVDGVQWPIVEMEWVSGQPLHQAVSEALDSPTKLRAMSDAWLEVTKELRAQRIAHGDLQHGNVLVDGDSRLRLVDFDGVWIPPIADLAPREVGHPNYQHPERIAIGAWGEHIDAFAAFVIYLSLRALAADPGLWAFHNGENLLLSAADYQAPSATPVWRRLAVSPDPEVGQLAALLGGLCRVTVNIETDLGELLSTLQIPDAPIYPMAGSTNASAWWGSEDAEPVTDMSRDAANAPIMSASWPTGRANVAPAVTRPLWPWFVAAMITLVLIVGIGIAVNVNSDSGTGVEESAPATSPPTLPTSVATAPATTPLASPPAGTPTIISADFRNGSEICASWTAVPGAEWYDGDYRLTSSGTSAALGRNPNTDGCQTASSGLGEVCFRIRAGNAAGVSPYSAQYCVNT